jgi:hypothetical protein
MRTLKPVNVMPKLILEKGVSGVFSGIFLSIFHALPYLILKATL